MFAKIYTSIFIMLLSMSLAMAQPISIDAARQQGAGAVVTVAGRVTNGAELGPIRYMQDGTAGVGAYFQAAQLTATPVNRGDSIIITGTLKQFNNLLEIDPITSYTVLASNLPQPAPAVFTAPFSAAYAEMYESQLVLFTNVTSITTSTGSAPANFAGNTNYRVNGSAATLARSNNNSTGLDGIVGKPVPTGAFDVVGIMSQFSATSSATGYQLLLRLFDDIITGPAPTLTTPVTQTGSTTTSLSLEFTTSSPGTTKVEYGTTTAFGSLINDPATVSQHSFTLNNLLPATIYYVKVSSTNAGGTSESQVYSFITTSLSSGRIITYFTRSVESTVALPGNNAVTLIQAVDDTIIAYINRATTTLDIAIYNFNSSGLSDMTAAINAAKARGVNVRMITDGSSANLGLNGLNASIPVLRSPQGRLPGGATGADSYTIMHNKFMIIDADVADPNKPILWTGSTNWTNAQINSDYNDVVIFQDQSMARVYKAEFEEMWGSSTLTPGIVFNGTTGTARFGPTKTDNTPHTVKVGGNEVGVYFSPTDGTTSQIVKSINSANSSFQFSVLALTRTDIGFAARDKGRQLGSSCSKGLVNDTGSTGSGNVFRTIAAGIGSEMKVYNLPSIFHHKYLIVDQEDATSDPLVFTGSHNWSTAGETKNDENSVVIHNQAVANQYFQEFAKRFAEVGGAVCTVTAVSPRSLASLSLAPNPAAGQLQVSGLEGGASYSITTITGQAVLAGKLSPATATVSLKGISAGLYNIRIATVGGVQTLRFVKE